MTTHLDNPFRRGMVTALACAALLIDAPVAALAAPAADEKVVILHQDVPLYDVYAWERWGNFINAPAGGKTEIPYDAARLQVKVYTFTTGEIRAIRFNNAVRTHRHINQTDTVLYSWQAHRVQFVNDMAVVAGPGDFALHLKGVDHSGEEIRRGGGIDLEFAMANPGRHNDPTAYWSFARDNAIQPAASWQQDGRMMEAVGDAVAQAPATAARYRVRIAGLPIFPSREVYLDRGTVISGIDEAHDRLLFVLDGEVKITTGGREYILTREDAARAIRGREFQIEALSDVKFVQTSVARIDKR